MAKQAGSQSMAPSNWILSPRKDLLLFLATPLVILPLFFAAQTQFSVAQIALFVASFGALGHHLPGMLRAYGDRALFQRFKLRFIAAPIILSLVCIAYSLGELKSLILVATTWGIWHGMMQTYGFIRIYDAKAGGVDETTRRLDFYLCALWFFSALVLTPGRAYTLLDYYYKAGGPLIPATWFESGRWIVLSALVTVTLLYTLNTAKNWHRGRGPSLVKLLLMAISFGFWWYCSSFENMLIGILLFEVFHDVQYLSIVWVFNHSLVEKEKTVNRFTKFLFRRSGALLGMYVGLVFAYGYLNYVTKALPVASLQNALVGLLTASALLHFYFDGFIWKIHDRSNHGVLKIDRKDQQGPSSRSLPGFLANGGWKWSFFAIPLLWFGYREMASSVITDEQRTQAIAEALPTYSYANLDWGMALAEKGRFNQAITHYRQALQADERNEETHNHLALALVKQGDPTAAEPHFERALALKDDYTDARYNLGSLYNATGRHDKALEQFQEISKTKPDDVGVRFQLGQMAFLKGQYGEAAQAFKRVIQLQPTHPEARFHLGLLAQREGSLEMAKAHFKTLLETQPDHFQANKYLAGLFGQTGNLKAAEEYYLRANQAKPNDGEILINLGILSANQGANLWAEKYLRQAMEAAPKAAEPHYHMGNFLTRTGNRKKALTHFRKAIEIKPNHVLAHFNLATLLMEMEDLEQAGQHYQAALETNPDFAEAHNNLGLVLKQQGQMDQARIHFQRALALNPNYRQAQENLEAMP